tara:strand:- start:226 stop:399 length:174 start_codon:yes stop_codon:yes gene_type:complete
MDRNKLASIITRLHFCNNLKLESIEDWQRMKNYIMNLNDDDFEEKLNKFGLLDKEAS